MNDRGIPILHSLWKKKEPGHQEILLKVTNTIHNITIYYDVWWLNKPHIVSQCYCSLESFLNRHTPWIVDEV